MMAGDWLESPPGMKTSVFSWCGQSKICFWEHRCSVSKRELTKVALKIARKNTRDIVMLDLYILPPSCSAVNTRTCGS